MREYASVVFRVARGKFRQKESTQKQYLIVISARSSLHITITITITKTATTTIARKVYWLLISSTLMYVWIFFVCIIISMQTHFSFWISKCAIPTPYTYTKSLSLFLFFLFDFVLFYKLLISSSFFLNIYIYLLDEYIGEDAIISISLTYIHTYERLLLVVINTFLILCKRKEKEKKKHYYYHYYHQFGTASTSSTKASSHQLKHRIQQQKCLRVLIYHRHFKFIF